MDTIIKKVFGSVVHISLIAAISNCAFSNSAYGSEITLVDCNGVTRAQHQLESDNERFDIEIALQQNTPLPDKATLTSEDRELESSVDNGTLKFSKVGSGVYEVCDSEKLVKIARANFYPSQEFQLASAGGIGAATVALAGAGIAMGSGGSGGSSDSATIEAPISNNLSSTLETPHKPAPQTQPATIRPSANDRDCLNGAKVTPLSPFE